ncbi:hypothetical protein JCM8097_005290 [Rhodosporidiobolus ruineniae]
MVLLGYASTAASAAGSYAFSAASSYVFRQDASTSTGPPNSTRTGDGAPSSPTSSSSSSSASSSSSPSPPSTPSRRLSVRKSEPGGGPRHRLPSSRPPSFYAPSSASSSSSSSASTSPSPSAFDTAFPPPPRGEAEDLVDVLNEEEDLYRILGVGRRAKTEEIRRAFLARSRVIHPDKLPLYPPSTTAFQRLSYAYETLSKPSSRRIYDLGGGRGYDPATPTAGTPDLADETLNGVLWSVVTEFLNGDFEMIRVFVTALNEGNPSLNLGDEAVDNIEGAFKRVREAMLSGQRYLRLIKFELIRLYEIQHSLRALSYFDLYGRLRLTLALTRVTLEIPMVLDRAMRDELPVPPPTAGIGAPRPRRHAEGGEGGAEGGGGQLERRGLLGTRTRGMLVVTCKMLEKAERWTGSEAGPASSPSSPLSGSAASVSAAGGGGGAGQAATAAAR